MDSRLHADRRDGRAQRRHSRAWTDLPAGSFVVINEPGRGGEAAPALVLTDRLVPWSPRGYGPAVERPGRGDATVLTPRASTDVLSHGYRPAVHPSAS